MNNFIDPTTIMFQLRFFLNFDWNLIVRINFYNTENRHACIFSR